MYNFINSSRTVERNLMPFKQAVFNVSTAFLNWGFRVPAAVSRFENLGYHEETWGTYKLTRYLLTCRSHSFFYS